MLEATPPPAVVQSRLMQPRPSIDTSTAPPPGFLGPPSKKRRVTISGGPHPLNTDVGALSMDPSNSTPISPAVMGFTIGRDDPAAIEQVRSMLTVKQRQKALIEQRRGSVAGIVTAVSANTATNEQRRGSVAGILTVATSGNSPRAVGATRLSIGNAAYSPEERPVVPKPPTSARNTRRSPNAGSSTNTRRAPPAPPTPSAPVQSPIVRPPSPSPLIVPSQQTPPAPIQENNNLPPPPISFARRRAGQFSAGKNKPADIMISPRDAQTFEQLAPSIQSAPPVPHAQGLSIGRFPMTLPRLPAAMGDSQNLQRVTSGRVPPTPTRLTMQRGSTTTTGAPGASVPIATTLVPPTPTSLHRPGYIGEKSSFLAPFEMFYDSLNDSKQLKNWLSEQLQKSNTLMQSLKQQQDNMDEIVERAVERKTSRMRDDISTLHQRVEELEGALRLSRADDSGRRPSIDLTGGAKNMGKFGTRNGLPPGPEPPAAYTFPPIEPSAGKPDFLRRISSPGWGHDSSRDARGASGPERTPPSTPMDADRRMSLSSGRYEPARPQPLETVQSRGPRGGLPPLPPSSKTIPTLANLKAIQARSAQHDKPPIPRNRSAADMNGASKPADGAETGRRNSVIMSPPEDTRRSSGHEP